MGPDIQGEVWARTYRVRCGPGRDCKEGRLVAMQLLKCQYCQSRCGPGRDCKEGRLVALQLLK